MIGGVNGRPQTLENKIARVIGKHYGVPARIIQRAGVVHLMRMSDDARRVIINDAQRQSVRHRAGRMVAKEQRVARFVAGERAA